MSKDPIGPAAERELQRVGAVVASLRAWRNLTQEGLGHQADVSYTQVKRMERGEGDLAVSFYIRIAHALDVPVAWLFDKNWADLVADEESHGGGGAQGG